jgi:uncharacterized protein with FMN-binding domain
MNKVALSLLVIAASGVYVWDQSRQQGTSPADAMMTADAAPASPTEASPARSDGAATSANSSITTDCAPTTPSPTPADNLVAITPPRPRPEITKAAMTTVASQGMADGTYDGPVTDAYYGPMQIEAVVQGGRVVSLRALQYPSDRRTSLAINRQALPMLRDEVIAAQSAEVDIITGATLTSQAFIRSLRGALAQAGQ